MLTGESLEQLHADLGVITQQLRAELATANAASKTACNAGDTHEQCYEMGRQNGLLDGIRRIERALERSEI